MNDEHLQMIEDCRTRVAKLTERERERVEECAVRLQSRPLSPYQRQTLEGIWERATANG